MTINGWLEQWVWFTPFGTYLYDHIFAIRCKYRPSFVITAHQFTMRFTLTFITFTGAVCAASASIVPRQFFPGNFLYTAALLCAHMILLVDCAIPCLQNADLGSCDPQDNVCLCNNQSFINSTTTCIENSCSADDLASAEAEADAICESVVCLFRISSVLGLTSVK
jgi:hypothetical protein